MVVVQHERHQVDVISLEGVLGVSGDGGLRALVQRLVAEGGHRSWSIWPTFRTWIAPGLPR